jgi:chromosome segregation ATPase
MRRAGARHGPSEAETQLGLLREQIAEAEAELIEREAELVDLRAELHAFQLEYDLQVGRTLEELAAIKEESDRRRRRINLYRQWGPKGPPRPGYIPVEEQYRRIWQQPPAPPPPPPPPPPDEATEGQIKRLYRELCHRFHPDLVTDRAEQAWRTEVMRAINAAYAARSLVELQTLAQQPDRAPAAEISTDAQRLAALQERLRQIEHRLREVEREIQELMDSPEIALSVEVKMARWGGRDLLAEMAAEAEAELAEKRAELDALKAEMERLGLGD